MKTLLNVLRGGCLGVAVYSFALAMPTTAEAGGNGWCRLISSNCAKRCVGAICNNTCSACFPVANDPEDPEFPGGPGTPTEP